MPLPLNWYSLSEQVTDIGTADAKIFVVPSDGFLRKVETVLAGAISGADETVTVSHNGTNLAPTITIANAASAAGDYDFAEFYRGVRKGDRIVVTNDGASTGATKAGITVTLSK